MGVFSAHLTHEVRLERMRPAQIEAARVRRPAVYVPFGAIEWHGVHNPVGLDGLKAHEQLVGLAVRLGGVVYPPVYFGAGGGHTQWPHSYLVSPEPMARLVADLLHGFQRDGYRAAILLSGHYPNRSQYLDAGVELYRQEGGTLRLLALVETEAPGVGGDHAARHETSALLYLDPETVDMAALGTAGNDIRGPDEVVNWMEDAYRGHPCYGLLGADPRRHASASLGRENTETLLAFLARWLDEDTGD
jgi:creatinine amidohydrolase